MASIYKRSYKVKLPDGRTVTRKCQTYTIEITNPGTGRRERHKGFKDKSATEQRAAQLERDAARGEVGMFNPFLPHRDVPIGQHRDAYISDLGTAGRDPKYIDNARHRLAVLFEGCGWKCLRDVTPETFLRWRERQKKAPRNGTRKTAEPKEKREASAATLNQYLDTARAFLNWCAATGRVAGVPVQGRIVSTILANVAKVEGPKVRQRRALDDEQVGKLLSVAAEDRKIVYRVALATGLRRSEIEQLKWGDLGLRATRPYIQLRAEATKARRGDRIDLPQTLAEELRKVKPDDAGEGDPVFPRVPSLHWWKADLAAAGIPYKDGLGRQADFHGGTRKTLCTRLNRAGRPPAEAMKLMRHTDIRLTMVDYNDAEQMGGDPLPELPAALTAPLPSPVAAATA